MRFFEFSICFFLFFNNFRTLLGDITVSGVQCGVKKCQIGDYCSDFEKQCRSCALICNINHHNFDENECNKNCQDYLHDSKYAQKDNASPSDGSLDKLKGEVQKLSHMVTITLTLVCFMFLVLTIVLGFQLYRWKIKKNITLKNLKSMLFKKPEAASDVRMEEASEKRQNSGNVKPDLRLDISNISTVSEHSPVTAITSISTRRPAEDSALDYAYDNHAMSASPK
ncbi:hypothetical protein HHI36_004181 [Cryptolaemus montrouzieri]|uniref:Uncharacterized protein n=1 Tax=Cryptolaemus montrouzieri TaxID=559131 RepID=A0ABD2NQF2_9CUCU